MEFWVTPSFSAQRHQVLNDLFGHFLHQLKHRIVRLTSLVSWLGGSASHERPWEH